MLWKGNNSHLENYKRQNQKYSDVRNDLRHTQTNKFANSNYFNWLPWLYIEDVQNVAEQELERKLTAKELRLVEGKIGNHINWYEAILNTMYASNIKP